MRDGNKRKREDESYCVQNVSQSHDYQQHATYQTSAAEQTPQFNQQAVLVNQPVLQNQLLYQLQRGNDQQQNLVYLLVPDNLQVQPVSILPNENQKIEEKPNVNYYEKNVQYYLTTETHVLSQGNNAFKQHLYRCDYKDCSESFYSLYEKKLHLDAHIFPESNEFKCSICNMVFEKAVDRNKHVESHSIPATYQCKQCRKYFTYYTVLVKHLEETKCSTKNPVSCYFCEMKIVDGEYLIKHHQLNMKQCTCGLKVCGNQAFELHRNACGTAKNMSVHYEKKRAKSRKT